MSIIRDLRQDPCYLDIVQMLQTQWPSNPFRASPQQAQDSGIDCLAILYRFLYASMSRGHWPPVEPGDTDQAILRYLWADFGHMEKDHVALRDQLRQGALAQIQGTMQNANVDFVALCGSPAMMEAAWARSAFRFYSTVWSTVKGEQVWKGRPDMQTPAELASMGHLEWDPKTFPALQAFMDQTRELKKEVPAEDGGTCELMWLVRDPLVIQVRLKVDIGVRLSLNDVHHFTTVVMRPGDNDPPVVGEPNAHYYNTPETQRYVLVAVVKTRYAALGANYDTIRLFSTNGGECVPLNTAEFADRQSWEGGVDDALPAGFTFVLFYRRVPEFESNRLFDTARLVGSRLLTELVDRKLRDDHDWFEEASDDEGERFLPTST